MTQEVTKDKDYTKRLEEAFARIMTGYREVVPQYKSDIESLRERLINIRNFANRASAARYLKDANSEFILANLITQILQEADEIDKLKPVKPMNATEEARRTENFLEVLAGSKELKLDEALSGFEFFDNNPYRVKAEKRLAKIKSKKNKK